MPHGLRNATRCISRASREGSSTDGLRGFERNHGNVASPGRLPSDWLFLAFPPIPWILARVSPRRAAPRRAASRDTAATARLSSMAVARNRRISRVTPRWPMFLDRFDQPCHLCLLGGETQRALNLFNPLGREESLPASRKWTLVASTHTYTTVLAVFSPRVMEFLVFRGPLCFDEIICSCETLRDWNYSCTWKIFFFCFSRRSYGLYFHLSFSLSTEILRDSLSLFLSLSLSFSVSETYSSENFPRVSSEDLSIEISFLAIDQENDSSRVPRVSFSLVDFLKVTF